jgi:hypothetical protein
VRSALRERLLTLPWLVGLGVIEGARSVAWEGVVWPGYTEIDYGRRPYLREVLKPNGDAVISLGPNPPVRHSGLYLIDVFVPLDFGLTMSDQIAGELLDHFAAHTTLTYDTQVVNVRTVYRAPPLTGTDSVWLQAPVTVEWFADTLNVV